MKGAAQVFVVALLTAAIAIWSLRLKRRVYASPEPANYPAGEYGMLYVFLFPIAGISALVALLMAISSLRNEDGSEPVVEDVCANVETAVTWLSSGDPATYDLGLTLATLVWDRTLTDETYSIALRRECPVQVVTMRNLADLSHNP